MNTPHRDRWEVAIIGGGAAGLSAALALARARRSVIVVDGGRPRNAPAAAAHGLLGHEGVNPLELLERGRSEAAAYGAHTIHADVVEASGSAESGFALRLDDGSVVPAGQLLIATGVRDERPQRSNGARVAMTINAELIVARTDRAVAASQDTAEA